MCYDVWCVFPFAPRPLVFIGGSHGQGELHLQVCLLELTYTSNEEALCGRFESVGPMGWSTDQGGRAATQWAQMTHVGCFLGPLVIGMCYGFYYVGSLLWLGL